MHGKVYLVCCPQFYKGTMNLAIHIDIVLKSVYHMSVWQRPLVLLDLIVIMTV